MKNICLHHWKLLCAKAGINFQPQKTFKCNLSNLNWRRDLQWAPCHQNNFLSQNTRNKRELNISAVNYSTKNNKYKLNKPRLPEEAKPLPTFQYASENSRPRAATRIYIWGNAVYGALGISEYLIPERRANPRTKQHRPARLPFIDDHDVMSIACGYGFTVLAARQKGAKEQAVFGTGLNTDSQIGVHPSKRLSADILAYPSRLNMPFEAPTVTKIKQIACGRAHTLILTDREGIFSLGNNAYGQCGRPVIENEEYRRNPKINKLRFEDEIEEIVCGQDNSIFLTKNGEVYTCGWGADGQLGTGTYSNEWKAAKVGGDIAGERIKQISCAADCVLAVSEKGELFGWGNNEYCQLCDDSEIPQLPIPRHISTKGCGSVEQVAAAGTMCAMITTEGQVFVWGYGILGMGPEVQHQSTFTPLPMTLFGRNEFSPTTTVTTLRSSLSHFAAITNEGNLYMWGSNKHGCLGLGMSDDQFFPLRVSVPGKVTEIACGVDHTAVICKTII